MENKSITNLKKYLEDELKNLDLMIKFFNISQSEIDKKLDRINEIREMITELQIQQGA